MMLPLLLIFSTVMVAFSFQIGPFGSCKPINSQPPLKHYHSRPLVRRLSTDSSRLSQQSTTTVSINPTTGIDTFVDMRSEFVVSKSVEKIMTKIEEEFKELKGIVSEHNAWYHWAKGAIEGGAFLVAVVVAMAQWSWARDMISSALINKPNTPSTFVSRLFKM
jgi:hypothetical protein